MLKNTICALLACSGFALPTGYLAAQESAVNVSCRPTEFVPHRVIVLTDIEADPDDTQSLVRLLLYSNEIDIEGIIATTSTHQKGFIAPESIRRVIRAYSKVEANLRLHDAHYPEAASLLKLVKEGLPVYGMEGVGQGKESEGSAWIVKTLEADDERPLWISVWGGSNTLAQALHTIQESKTEAEARRLISKLRVYTISDQDDSGAWIRRNFPELFYIVSPGGYGAATWTGMNQEINGLDNTTVSNTWLAEHIQQGKGPLGSVYPDVAYGMEGDTPAFLGLIPNGLNNPEHPDFGGWGGRYELYMPELEAMDPEGFTGGVPIPPETRPIWTNATDCYTPPVKGAYGRNIHRGTQSYTGYRETLWRWRDDFQNDFAARINWTILPYEQANHAPVPVLKGPDRLTVSSGAYVTLDASASEDPDGDSLTYYWLDYPEAGTCTQPVEFAGAENLSRIGLKMPVVETAGTIHIILKLSDKGSPSLTRYKRIIITVQP